MAEIHIQRKRTVWPWVILALLVLALVVWFFFGRSVPRTEPVVVGTETAPAATAPAASAPAAPAPAAPPAASMATGEDPVADFLRYAEQTQTQAGLSHEYTADGLRRLADALAAIAQRDQNADVDVEQKISVLRERADAMQREPTATAHAAQAREAMVGAADLMQALQQKRFPALEKPVAQAREAATGVNADGQLLAQADAVKRFFERSAEIVRGMAA